MLNRNSPPAWSPLAILFVALSLSIGWGVRGNWGHEYGAMIPGALAAMAAALASGRDDWYRRIGFFAFYGALGWSFGGSISYMKVIGYTHSGHPESVIYGFACLFLIGFIWAAFGGAGTALSAFLDRQRLTELLIPVFVVFLAWAAQDQFFNIYLGGLDEQLRQGTITQAQYDQQTGWISWNDTDWIGVVVAAAAVLVLAVARNRVCWGTSLALHMCGGWWLGFTLLTIGLGLRMTPPRGDNWAGALGMMIGMFVFLYRQRDWGIAWTALVSGFFGGLGFSGATLIKLVLVNPGFQERVFGHAVSTNWHSILEQTFGFISGIGIALALAYLSTRSPRLSEEPLLRRWAEPLTVLFVVLVISYVNIVKNMEAVWFKNGTVAEALYGYQTSDWFRLAYLALAAAIAVPVLAWWRGRPVELMPASRLGKAQLLYVVFLWWIVIGNFTRTVPFAEQRLITEGVIHVNACLCTLLAILLPSRERQIEPQLESDFLALIKRFAASLALVAAIVVIAEFALVRALWGDTFAGHAGKSVRFGPEANNSEK
ncbi:MAG: hypothetical protein AB7O59_01170 [Pirellulales bacterium]